MVTEKTAIYINGLRELSLDLGVNLRCGTYQIRPHSQRMIN